jgi:hypothetical protein
MISLYNRNQGGVSFDRISSPFFSLAPSGAFLISAPNPFSKAPFDAFYLKVFSAKNPHTFFA